MLAGLLLLADKMRLRGATLLLAAPAGTPGCNLPRTQTTHSELDSISAIQSLYPMVELLSRARSFDLNHPKHLAGVTCTH